MLNVDRLIAVEEIDRLLSVLPETYKKDILAIDGYTDITEIVIDLARPMEIRLPDATLLFDEVQQEDIDNIVLNLGEFGVDDRTGISGTLHRISRIDNKAGRAVGLTFRVGRDHPSNRGVIEEFCSTSDSILILGAPCTGKTTMLRSIAHHYSVHEQKRVVIIDTSNEIGGEGDIPHSAIGRARRMQVPRHRTQAEIMLAAVENHNPSVLIIDEISTMADAKAARSIAQRGVQLIATAHGRVLQDLINSPELSSIVGGIQQVTVGDRAARHRDNGNKTKLERAEVPTFTRLIELHAFDEFQVCTNIQAAVDNMLAGGENQLALYRVVRNHIQCLQRERLKPREQPIREATVMSLSSDTDGPVLSTQVEERTPVMRRRRGGQPARVLEEDPATVPPHRRYQQGRQSSKARRRRAGRN